MSGPLTLVHVAMASNEHNLAEFTGSDLSEAVGKAVSWRAHEDNLQGTPVGETNIQQWLFDEKRWVTIDPADHVPHGNPGDSP